MTANIVLRQHSTVTTATGTLNIDASNTGIIYGCQAPVASFSFYASQPVLAFSSASCPVALVTCLNTGSGQWTALFWSAAPTTFDVYVFDSVMQIPSSGTHCGLQVFDASGNLIADATLPMLRPIQYVSGTVGNLGQGWYGGTGWPGAFANTYNTGVAKVATACAVTASAVYSPGGNSNAAQNTFLGMSGWQHSVGTAVMSWNNYVYGSPGTPSYYVGYGSNLNWAGLLIDVSNF